jgi:hypothetical protein
MRWLVVADLERGADIKAAALARGMDDTKFVQQHFETILDVPVSGEADFGIELQPTLDGPPMLLSARALPPLPEAPPLLMPKVAAALARVDESTIVRWAQRYGIGSQLRKHGPWRIDPLGLQIVMNGDAAALEAYKAGSLDDPAIAPYLAATG